MGFLDDEEMNVIKRNGEKEIVSFDKILKRIKKIGTEVGIQLNYTALTIKVIDQLYNGISTTQIDELTAEQCASLASTHPDYNILAGRLIVSNHQKNTSPIFSQTITYLYNFKDKHNNHSPLISSQLYDTVMLSPDKYDGLCDYSRDYLIDYFGFKTLERAYLMKIGKTIVERPQHMWLRVAIGIHGDNFDRVKETYDCMSQKYFTHATPTLFNAGTPRPQLSSCFLIAMENDSISGIYSTLSDCANISKWAGGIGMHIHNIRATGSHIRGTNGTSNGIVPMLRVFNNTAKYVDQCIHPETIIYTTQGPKQIQHCEMGVTSVYNLHGEPEVIENVLEHTYDDKMLEIHTMHSIFPLQITHEHPIYVLRNQKKGLNYNVIRNRLEKKLVDVDWVEAKELDEDDMIAYSIPNYEMDNKYITEEDCRMYGIILGDGSLNNSNNGSGYISLHTHNKKDMCAFILQYFENRCIQCDMTIDANTTRIRWNKHIELPFRYNDFYDENKQKRILPKWLNLPLHKSKQILKGLIETDGCYNISELVFDSTSLNLIECVRFLCLKMGILTSGYVRDRIGEKHYTANGIIENKRIGYCLRIPRTNDICNLMGFEYKKDQFFKFFRHNNLLFTRVQSIRETTYNGIVYDLQMPTEHNYMIHNGLIHNGGGKRNGSFAIYLEPWHADIEVFLQMRKNHGDEELKARDLFYALWIPDLFMERIKTDGNWTLMCPDECPGLADVYGDEFKELYEKYESQGLGRITMSARKLWFQILDAQMETGTPYLCYKDAANRKTNQKNIGIIKSSNLCTEVMEVSTSDETAVCNLASIALPAFIDNTQTTPVYNFEELHRISRIVTYNLNKVIDVNYYPTSKTKTSNDQHRPIGIGVQGLADTFIQLGYNFESEEAKQLNREIFETIYHAALAESCLIAQNEGSYSSFDGSPASEGILQFDMWNVTPDKSRYDWDDMKSQIKEHGLRNSLLLAPMPTASTSQILGYNECIEPITSNIYSRRTLAGEFIIANKYLMYDLIKLNLWNDDIKNNIIANNGSVQHIDVIPIEIRDKYKTVWEIPMRSVIDMAADRGAYICQSQSLNLWLEDPNYNSLTSMHFYAWNKGLKTGIYYLRRRGRHQAQQFTIEPDQKMDNEEDDMCEACGS
jgi:ribonucleoside-diphosphate reductase alpha subunit